MLKCDDVIAELSSFLDGDVEAEVRHHVEHHLKDCTTCTAIYDSARKTLKIVTDSATFEVPTDLTTRIMARLRSKDSGKTN